MKTKTIQISKLKPNTGQLPDVPKNPRFIKDARFEKLKKSIEDNPEMLEIREVVAVERAGQFIVIMGNMRVRAMKDLGYKEATVKVLPDTTPAENIRAYIIKDNVGFGSDDFDALANEWDALELDSWGLELGDIELNGLQDSLEANEDDYEMPNEIQTDIVLGDLFEIGEHRLLCGDSTCSDTVARLMNGEKADMVFTDPPYGYKYESNYQNKHKELLNDDIILDFIPNAFLFSKNNIAIYIFCGWQTLTDWIGKVKENDLDLKNIIVWKKNNWSMGDLKGAYAGQYEIILFCHKGRIELKNGRGRDVWEFDRVPPTDHPTMKPLELIQKAINDTTKAKDLIIDLFLGSGSTMVASHQLKRKCYGIELDPKYCQVIIDRMRKLDPDLIIKKNGVVI